MRLSYPDFSDLCELGDLGMAYRKVKVDLFYASRRRRRALLEYESDLMTNLSELQDSLRSGSAPSIPHGAWTVVPKKLEPEGAPEGFFASDPAGQWKAICRASTPTAEFRLMEELPIDFHVFATLWIHKVGHKLEAKLSGDVRGNRLRRHKDGRLNLLALGTNPPYIHAYRKWRDDGMTAIRRALENEKRVVAITADASSFYHHVDAAFMLEDSFFDAIGVELTPSERALHQAFVDAICRWACATPHRRGLPVGLSASSILANLMFFELDSQIKAQLAPLYYGRYVDDILLAVEDTIGHTSSEEVWDWLCQRLGGLLSKHDQGSGSPSYHFEPSYQANSLVEFSNNKNKTFVLSGLSGKSLLSSIEKHIREQASEWHALPELPSDAFQIESNLLSAMKASGEPSDSLRQADSVSVQRAAFAINLRNVEAYSRAIPPEGWAPRRHAFMGAMIRHVLTLPAFFRFYDYLPRLIELASASGDVRYLLKIVEALERILADLENCSQAIAGESRDEPEILSKFRDEVTRVVSECIETSFVYPKATEQRLAWTKLLSNELVKPRESDLRGLQRTQLRLFLTDLAHRPLKHHSLPDEVSVGPRITVVRRAVSTFSESFARLMVEGAAVASAKSLVTRVPTAGGLLPGFLFPTRPPTAYEMFVLTKDAFHPKGAATISTCLLGFRGLVPEPVLPTHAGKVDRTISVPLGRRVRPTVRIAVASWHTSDSSWVAAVSQNPDPDSGRLDRLFRLLNSVMSCPRRLDYLIMPESSLPPSWFLGAALGLQRKGISLVGGIEYLHKRPNFVRNQTWASLIDHSLGYASAVHYAQDKQRPAQKEERALKRIAGRILKPEVKWPAVPLIDHGGFRFAILTCSELTNIRNRADVRGEVDALFVPEWNKDTETFNALVESAALDIHAYIIQCNNRMYGDSRIRVARKKAWERDILRVKGGIDDYFVVGEIDIGALRQFQSNHRSPPGPFKPVPDGFKPSPEREVLPGP